MILPPGTLSHPKGLAVKGSRLYIADDQRHRILVTDTGGKIIRSFGGSGHRAGPARTSPTASRSTPRGASSSPTTSTTGSCASAPRRPATRTRRAGARTAAVRGSSRSCAGSRRTARATSTSPTRATTASTSSTSTGGCCARSGRSGRAEGQFNTPSGVAADSNGIRAVTDAVNGRVRVPRARRDDHQLDGLAQPGPDDPAAAGRRRLRRPRQHLRARPATGDDRRLQPGDGPAGAHDRHPGLRPRPDARPVGLALDGAGNIYVADSGNDRIVRFTARATTSARSRRRARSAGVAVTPDGSRIYTTVGNFIRVWSPDGSEIDSFGGSGRNLGKLNTPAQLTLDQAGNVWVADRGNNRVQQFGPDGERLAMVGERGTGTGQFTRPTGVSVDCRGTLTVTDSDNNRVQQFTLAAPVTPPGSLCAALPLPARPAPPKLPTGPVPDGPQVDLRALRTSRIISSRTLPIRVGCDTGCRADAAREPHAPFASGEGPQAGDGEPPVDRAHAAGGAGSPAAPEGQPRTGAPADAGAARAQGPDGDGVRVGRSGGGRTHHRVARLPGDRLTGPDGTVAPPATGGVTVSSGEGGSVRTRSRFALGGLAAVAACGVMACGAGAQTTTATVGAFPMPGVQSASPETQISLRGAPPAQLGSVTVSGSESGNHTGTLRPHSDGNGASFVLDKPLRGGETVSVKTDLTIPGARNGDYSFKTVSRPSKGLGSGGGKPNLQPAAGADRPGRHAAQGLAAPLPLPPRPASARGPGLPHAGGHARLRLHRAEEGLRGEDPRRPAERPDDRRQQGPAGLVRAERRAAT